MKNEEVRSKAFKKRFLEFNEELLNSSDNTLWKKYGKTLNQYETKLDDSRRNVRTTIRNIKRFCKRIPVNL